MNLRQDVKHDHLDDERGNGEKTHSRDELHKHSLEIELDHVTSNHENHLGTSALVGDTVLMLKTIPANLKHTREVNKILLISDVAYTLV